MIAKLRYIVLYPISLIFGIVSSVRNFLYDKRILKSKRFDIPVISVGNLAVGGTGKTPHTEYILSLLQYEWETAMLSRGYKRWTKGFILADKHSNAFTVGDEPYQIHMKYPNVTVAVDEDRVRGVENLLRLYPHLGVVVLDDAFQHRAIKAGYSVLLTDYSRLYTRDFYLPSGRLRESKKGSRRTDIIVVTKCPSSISVDEMRRIESEIKPREGQELFFSTLEYGELIPVFPAKQDIPPASSVLFMAGIVSPRPAIQYLKSTYSEVEPLLFPDHHNFTVKDFENLSAKFEAMNTEDSIIVVTEKDASRIISHAEYPEALKEKTFALPIRVKILDGKEQLFNEKIRQYVGKNTTNG